MMLNLWIIAHNPSNNAKYVSPWRRNLWIIHNLFLDGDAVLLYRLTESVEIYESVNFQLTPHNSTEIKNPSHSVFALFSNAVRKSRAYPLAQISRVVIWMWKFILPFVAPDIYMRFLKRAGFTLFRWLKFVWHSIHIYTGVKAIWQFFSLLYINSIFLYGLWRQYVWHGKIEMYDNQLWVTRALHVIYVVHSCVL